MTLRAVLLLVAVIAGSCSAGGPVETRLVSRVRTDAVVTCDGQRVCRIEDPGGTWRAADGRAATMEPVDVQWRFEKVSRRQVECRGELIQHNEAYRLVDAGTDRGPRALVFDDGSAVDLHLDAFVNATDRCSESVGRWDGVAGTFEGRSGTFRWTDDLVQVEVVLTDS